MAPTAIASNGSNGDAAETQPAHPVNKPTPTSYGKHDIYNIFYSPPAANDEQDNYEFDKYRVCVSLSLAWLFLVLT